ncbi:hypothetical protein GCM10010232_45620 [Streptomyces amakusaensis]
MRRRHRDVPVWVTWTVPCAIVLLCPHLVICFRRASEKGDAPLGPALRSVPGPPGIRRVCPEDLPHPDGGLRGLSAPPRERGRTTVARVRAGS